MTTMTVSDILKGIATSQAVWSAFLLLLHLVITRYAPNVPPDILGAVEGLFIAILGAIGIGGVVIKVVRARFGSVRNALGVIVARLRAQRS